MNGPLNHFFSKGLKADLENILKDKESYVFGENGRVYVKDGTLAFTSADGTEEVYNNPNISKILGSCVFKDRIIVFAKSTGLDVNVGGVIYETEDVQVILAKNFEIDCDSSSHDFSTEFTDNTELVTYSQEIATPLPPEETDIDDNYAPEGSSDESIDYDTYYSLNINVPSFGACVLTENSAPINNANYSDSIWDIQINDQSVFIDKLLWAGYQNWPTDGKILTIGVEENSNFMRVKYTDNVNNFRSINVYDPDLYKRSAKELANFQSTILLEPRIESINTNGSLKSMAVQYYYRLITDNGQVTEFSPASEVTFIYPDENIITGGTPSEVTNKSVSIVCNVVDPKNFAEIEVIAAEYEGSGLPTNIVTLGIQEVGAVNRFTHFGSEANFATDVTLQELIETKLNWKYCSDLDTKNNKLLACGLRSDPIDSRFSQLKYLFALHGWADDNSTHTSFINPNPVLYNKIPVGFTENLFFVNKRVYRFIKIFQDATITFRNTATGDSIETSVSSNSNFYIDRTQFIAAWLLDQEANNVDFGTYFPNLTVEATNNVILLAPTDDNVETDFSVYRLEYNTTQVVEEIDDETILYDRDISGFPKTHGALSAGFNSGSGVRITFRMVEDELATQAQADFDGSSALINVANPSFNGTFVKDEIYRLGINFYKDGERLFVIPMGDLKIPDMGEIYTYIDDNGNYMATGDRYVNQVVKNGKLYGVRVELRVEVRLDCEFSKDIDMYQLLHVERTEQNRTVLCQGISAPLLRMQDPPNYFSDTTNPFPLDEKLQAKWMLPYHGGPCYDYAGLSQYDLYGGEHDNDTLDWQERVIHDRSLLYFDSPDLIYGTTSDTLVKSSNLKVVGRINTDHTPGIITLSGDTDTINGVPLGVTYGTEQYPKFSRKIRAPYLNMPNTAQQDLPQFTGDVGSPPITLQTHFVNFSVFANFNHPLENILHELKGAVTLRPGEVIPGTELETSFDLSNNAMCLPNQTWWYANSVRNMSESDDQIRNEAIFASRASIGQKTMFLRTETDVFSDQMVGPATLPVPATQLRGSNGSGQSIRDTHLIINIKRTNQDSIYGGRSELSFSQNKYIPISETKPVLKTTNGSQAFNVQGDAYISLYLRAKNAKNPEGNEIIAADNADVRRINNGRGSNPEEHDLEEVYLLEGAWAYGAVLETMIEPKLNDEYEFYRETQNIDFYQLKDEQLNGAYLKRNNAKTYIPQPFRFKDDPLYTNIVAASEVKLSGEYFDAWSTFLPNEFQELDKNKGGAFNLVKWNDEVFAIQERQTNLLYIDRDVMIPSDSGAINLKQGAGKSIDGYKIISEYGTSIRRSIVNHKEFGFSFIDETNNTLIKVDKPLLIENQYHHDFWDSLEEDPIANVEAFYNPKFKESCFQITTKSGVNRILAYNEVLKTINGYYDFYSPHFIVWDSLLLAPWQNNSIVGENEILNSNSLHQINAGLPLNYFGEEKNMTLTFITSPGPNIIAIFKHISMMVGKDTTILRIDLETKEGVTRSITPDHFRYKVRENIHTVPLMNEYSIGMDQSEKGPLRSEYTKVTIVFPYTGAQQKIVSSIIDIRKSII